jgi:DNA replication and repair protein RecF
MFQLRQIALTQFKNYSARSFAFQRKVVGICGANGTGKTNLLDAIWYLCFTKSYFSSTDSQVAMQGLKGFRVEGNFVLQNEPAKVVAIVRETGKKELSLNEETYTRMSRHIGKLPSVMIAPDDVAIITGSSEERRKLFDTLLCQLNPDYLQQLMDYNKLLQQRNSLLKQFAEMRRTDETLLQIIDDQLVACGVFVYNQRKHFLRQFLEKATEHYHTIANSNEEVQLTYESQLHTEPASEITVSHFKTLLLHSRVKDFALQRTTSGIHRDDLKLHLNQQSFKQVASQGQRKSLLFALKLTEFEMLQQHKGFAPLLLLDDVFEKLDNRRMANLLTEVCMEKQGQVFITDTHRDRLEAQLSAIGCDYEIVEIGL